ncbi:MAG: hypothetical protein AAFN63_03755 [Pseudomonadota bacterium]
MTDLTDQALKNEICANPRFQKRLGADLLKYVGHSSAFGIMSFAQKGKLASVLSHPQDRMLRQLGYLWLAPVLASRLFDPLHREAMAINDREELHAVMRYKTHAAAAAVAPSDAAPDYVAQGLLCLLAWFSQFPTPVGCALMFTYPQAPFEDCDVVHARADFADSAFSDDTLRWAEDQ